MVDNGRSSVMVETLCDVKARMDYGDDDIFCIAEK